jgi:hypothetical protein
VQPLTCHPDEGGICAEGFDEFGIPERLFVTLMIVVLNDERNATQQTINSSNAV